MDNSIVRRARDQPVYKTLRDLLVLITDALGGNPQAFRLRNPSSSALNLPGSSSGVA